MEFQLSFYVPHIRARAQYRSSGVLIMVQATGGGDYWGEYGKQRKSLGGVNQDPPPPSPMSWLWPRTGTVTIATEASSAQGQAASQPGHGRHPFGAQRLVVLIMLVCFVRGRAGQSLL